MSKVISLKRGFDIRLKGKAESVLGAPVEADTIALKPTDFSGLIPKLCVKQDQTVKKGDALFYDKYNPEILFTSPVSGVVVAINRGERRKILEVVVKSDGKNESVEFGSVDLKKLSREEIIGKLLKSGLWPFIKRRPYGILAKPKEMPKNIFISGFDTAPLAPDYDFVLHGEESTFQAGVNVLGKLTEGNVFLGLNNEQSNGIFDQIKNVKINKFSGPHPAGNVGVQIHHINPINKGDIVWTIDPQAVVYIGRLFEKGTLDMSKVIALTGSEVKAPKYYKCVHATTLDSLLADTTKKESGERIISGNVLTGNKIPADSYLGFFDSQITVIPEGDDYEFIGWAKPGVNKFSASKTFLSSLLPKKEYVLDSNLHGGERAFVLTGQYEKFLPMDILPVYLLKAVLVNDIDKMEQLGIYELIEEDMALCEYSCVSKIKVQDVLRQGINLMIKELG